MSVMPKLREFFSNMFKTKPPPRPAPTGPQIYRFDLKEPLKDGTVLYTHQRQCVYQVWHSHRQIIAMEIGTGKTRAALMAAKGYALPILVICPASVRENWRREADVCDVLIDDFSWAKMPEPYDRPYVLIADECHLAANIQSARTKALLKLALDRNCQAVMLLSGTPILNGKPVELFPLLLATKHRLAEDKWKFYKRYCYRVNRFTKAGWDSSGAQNLEELHEKTKDIMFRRTKAECLDLPPLTRILHRIELSPADAKRQEAAFKVLREDYYRRRAEGVIGEADAITMLAHMRRTMSLAKVASAIEIARDILSQGHQVVLFSAFPEAAIDMALGLDCQALTGATPTAKRQGMVDRFQSGEKRALVCTLGAGSVGLNMQAASYVLLADRDWIPAIAFQAEGRAHRSGQKRNVTSIWLQAGELDEAIDLLLLGKQERNEIVVEGRSDIVGSGGHVASEMLRRFFGG